MRVFLWPILFAAIMLSSCTMCKLPRPNATQSDPIPPIIEPTTLPSTPETETGFGLSPPETHQIGETLNLWATYYRIHVADSASKGIPLIGKKNTKLGPKLNAKDWCEAALEGTVSVKQNGKMVIYNYLDHKGEAHTNCHKFYGRYLKPALIRAMNKTRFVKADSLYGYGVQDWQLAPYRTIAVDKNVIPYGSLIYIPSARGLTFTLPDGQTITHDGYFFAGDTGGAIKKNHIDVFAGFALENPFPEFIHSSAKKTFRAYLVNNETLRSRLAAEHENVPK